LIPSQFEYHAPLSLNEATDLLSKYGSEAKVLAGGMSLIPVMKLRLASPRHLVDINRIPGLDYIKESAGFVLLGALCRHGEVERSKLVKEKLPILYDTATSIGDPQIRNLGTICGSLVHSDPSGDWAASILALHGQLKIRSSTDERRVTIDDFLVDTFTSAVGPNEILTELSIPIPPPKSGGAYLKMERRAGDFATVGIAAQITLDRDGACTYAGIGLTALGPKSLRATKAEKSLIGRELTEKVIEDASAAVADETKPIADPLRGDEEYKRQLARIYTRRALNRALTRAMERK
jgi:aerobic carbon-monoxide dehydrogenase medium subunit